MNNKIYYILITLLFFSLVSCNNEWEDEQYTQFVSFKAEPNDNGVTFVNIRYNPEGKVVYNLPVIVSGSTLNTQNRSVSVGLDLDTLSVLNYERYGHREELYFKNLTSSYYSFDETIDIPVGESLAVLPIEFTLGDLDQSDKWVVPLTILDDPSYNYSANPHLYFRKAILHINPFNDYSGTYSGTMYKIFLEGDDQNSFSIATHRAFVADDKTVFIYAGTKNIDSEDRKFYKIFLEFTDDIIDLQTKKLRVYTDNPEINLVVKGEPSYSITEEMDVTKPYLKHIYITLKLDYEFVDYTTTPSNPVKYFVTGSLSMQRDLNTLIPDEDQQIQW